MIYEYRIQEDIHYNGKSYYYIQYKCHINPYSQWEAYSFCQYPYKWIAELAIKRLIRRDKRKTTKETKYHPYP